MRLQSRLKTLTTQMQKKNNLLTLLRLQKVCMWFFFVPPVSLADRIIWKMLRMDSILCAVISRGQKAYFSLTLKNSDISVSQNIRFLLGQWWTLSPDKGSERKALVHTADDPPADGVQLLCSLLSLQVGKTLTHDYWGLSDIFLMCPLPWRNNYLFF